MAVVTISRTAGSLGDEVARGLADRLGYRLVGRAELLALASGSAEPDELARSPEMRERTPSFWERLNEERRRYGSVLRDTVLQLAEQDNVVIVGLGAGLVLRRVRHVLRVQIVAPQELRLARVMESGTEERPGPITRDQARDYVRHRDREAAGYIRYLFNVEWLEPQNWDVVLNTGSYDASEAAAALAAMVEAGVASRHSEDDQQLRDLALAARIESTLLNHPNVWVSGLRVTSTAGQVVLEGEILAEEDREVVEQIVREFSGVRAVENELRIQPPPLTGI